MLLTGFREAARKDWIVTLVLISLSIAAISVGAVFLLLAHWYIWLTIVGAIILLMVAWHAKSFGYRCANCGHEFEVSIVTELVSAHGISKSKDGHSYGWYYLKCPNCQERSRATVIKKE